MDWEKKVEGALESLKQKGLLRSLDREPLRSFSHNDYLGLAQHPALLGRARDLIAQLAGGSTGSRLLGGNHALFEKVESEIADFFQSPSALFFSSGYLANLAAVTSLSKLSTQIVSDEQNHASLIDGIRLSSVEKTIVAHQAWPAPCPEWGSHPLIVAESLYSMDGDIVKEEALRRLWSQANAFLLLDESHAGGVMDESGTGLSAPWRDWSRMAVTVTFGKAFGVSGAAILCSRQVRDLILNSGRSFIFTTAPSPWVAALVLSALELMKTEGPERREQLWKRAEQARGFFRQQGLPIELFPEGKEELLSTIDEESFNRWKDRSPVLPVYLGTNDRALRFAEVMREFDWGVKAIRYPTVPLGTERVRISLNLAVSQSDTERFVEKMVQVWKAFL